MWLLSTGLPGISLCHACARRNINQLSKEAAHLQDLVQQVGCLVEAVHQRHLALLLKLHDRARQLATDLSYSRQQTHQTPAVAGIFRCCMPEATPWAAGCHSERAW